MSYDNDGELTITSDGYRCLRLIHTRYDYRQDCIMKLMEGNYDLIIHKLKHLFATDNKHMLISECDAISNVTIIFSCYVPLGMTVELRQFSRNKTNVQKINYKIINNRTIKLQLENPINIVYYNNNSYLYFSMDSTIKNNIYLEYDVIFCCRELRDNLLGNQKINIDYTHSDLNWKIFNKQIYYFH